MVKKARVRRLKIINNEKTNFKALLYLSLFVVLILSVIVVTSSRSFGNKPKAAAPSIGKNDSVCKKEFTDYPNELWTACQATTNDRCQWIVEDNVAFTWYNMWHNPDLKSTDYKFVLHKEVKCGNAPKNNSSGAFYALTEPNKPTSPPAPLFCCVLEKVK